MPTPTTLVVRTQQPPLQQTSTLYIVPLATPNPLAPFLEFMVPAMTKEVTPRNKLNVAQTHALCVLVQAEYATRNSTDIEFAEYATQTLKFSINTRHVRSVRQAFNIPSTRTANAKPALEQRVAALEEEVHRIKKLLQGH